MSGLGHEGWKDAMQAFCCGHNFAHASAGVAALSDEQTDKTAHEIRLGDSSPGTAYRLVLGYVGHASIPRSTMRRRSLKQILGKGYSWVTIYTQVDIGLEIISSRTRPHTPNTLTATCATCT
eukprot:6135644-Pyramimonas_sp.AAC.1